MSRTRSRISPDRSRPSVCSVLFALLLVATMPSQALAEPEPTHRGGGDETPPPPREPVILSTDMTMGLNTGNRNGIRTSVPDIDDSYAFALAHAYQLDIRGVVVTMGNSMVRPSMTTARQTVRAVGSDVPVVQGADVWLPVEPQSLADGTTFTDSCVNDGVRFMANELRRSGGLTIAAIGPLTDVACLALNYPEETKLITRIVALVGSRPATPLQLYDLPVVDFNYIMDPRAESVILQHTTVPFTAVTFDLSSQAPIAIETLRALATSSDPVARFYGQSSEKLLGELTGNGFPAYPIFDAAVVWHLISPQDHVCETAGFRLKPGSPATAQAGTTTSTETVTDTFSPEFTDTRQVRACTDFTSRQARDRYQQAILTAVGGGA